MVPDNPAENGKCKQRASKGPLDACVPSACGAFSAIPGRLFFPFRPPAQTRMLVTIVAPQTAACGIDGACCRWSRRARQCCGRRVRLLTRSRRLPRSWPSSSTRQGTATRTPSGVPRSSRSDSRMPRRPQRCAELPVWRAPMASMLRVRHGEPPVWWDCAVTVATHNDTQHTNQAVLVFC